MSKNHFHFVQRNVLRGVALLFPVLVLVAACAGGINGAGKAASLNPSGLSVYIPNPAQADQIMTFIVSAPASGRTGLIEMPGEDVPVRVRVERIYESASGHLCRRYHLSSSAGASTLGSHLACLGANGQWFRSRLLVNPDSLDGSGSGALRVGGS